MKKSLIRAFAFMVLMTFNVSSMQTYYLYGPTFFQLQKITEKDDYTLNEFRDYLKKENIPFDANLPIEYGDLLGLIIQEMANKNLSKNKKEALLSTLQFLLDQNVPINNPVHRTLSYYTPLMQAIELGSMDAVKLLLDQKNINLNNRNIYDNSMTALHYAVLVSKPEIVELLLRAGADQTITHARWLTPLESAQRFLSLTEDDKRRENLRKIIDLLKNPPLRDSEKKIKDWNI